MTSEDYEIPELCPHCEKNPVYYTGHGVRDGKLYDEFSCVPCFASRHHHVSQEKVERLTQELAGETLPTVVAPGPWKSKKSSPRVAHGDRKIVPEGDWKPKLA